MTTHFTVRRVVVPPGTGGIQLAPLRPSRSHLSLQNIGTGDLTVGFESAALTSGAGWVVPPAAANGQAGGSLVFSDKTTPYDSVFAVSTAGTTVVVMEG